LGPNPEEFSILTAETGKKTLTEAVAVLSAKTALLEPKNLDHFEGDIIFNLKVDNTHRAAPCITKNISDILLG
jgi:hypothetical protein